MLSVYHKGSYDTPGKAYAYLLKCAEDNGFRRTGGMRECYIDGIWNKESPEEWLRSANADIMAGKGAFSAKKQTNKPQEV